jgi:general secretion pathway protein K
MSVPARERGAALLAVLLLVAVMGAIAAGAFERLRLSTALAMNSAALDQARAYAVGVETLLALRIDDMQAQDANVTTLAGDWNGSVRRIPLPGDGLAEGAISDGGNCFNLNSVVQGAVETGLVPRPAGIAQFAGLMQALGVGEGPAGSIAAAAADWADQDGETNPAGAEDAAYAGYQRPYRTGNTLFAEVSELRTVQGMTPELYATLRPYLCALPAADLSPINVNTLLPGQEPLLVMLAPGLITPERARTAIAIRPATGWQDMESFLRGSSLRIVNLPMDALGQVQLSTRWFALDLKVEFQGAELEETALIDARLMPSRVALRRWGSED